MGKANPLTARQFEDHVVYDPATGIMRWRSDRPQKRDEPIGAYRRWVSRFGGQEVGTFHVEGYRQFAMDGVIYRVHRVAVAIVAGKCSPEVEVDHLDGDRSNNRWENLRLVDRSLNSKNMAMSSRNKSGVVGVSYDKRRDRWQVYGCNKYLGAFKNIDDAIAARQRWLDGQDGYTSRHGQPSNGEIA
ncbi:HNH endonuclease [Halomonas sp. McH1-25]|uniref:HNH endonuclease signature motif containing protein n=1 Tax=unclassified Halomonas TaxID=2609666 RepID=UPI001EF44EF2|nr:MULTISPECIES: HNH endonuclease signature motif containing protein [unclassified Halomonas]MCG7598871.1 HNH endonuclease [Halomonas sp. McH1-25]MCP1340834.1 HNH endonuclease [Halomonas sp. FL8]MCP1361283.1 HNH endonuclease [Halomonas sp. BBD45]MCP1363690.1 HNH endonuclease [Halomonas sp. BBD48]